MANGKTGSIAEAPPSTYSSWQVMKLAWSVHRRTTALPTSAGRPRRRTALFEEASGVFGGRVVLLVVDGNSFHPLLGELQRDSAANTA
jgi:hypothetical protein